MKRGKGDGAFAALLRESLKKAGVARKGNRVVETKGLHLLPLFDGPEIIGEDGSIKAYYFSSKIFGLDLKRKCITDFGMSDYSISTRANVHGWFEAAFRLFKIPGSCWNATSWLPDRHELPGSAKARYRARMPWSRTDSLGTTWFHWLEFDQDKADFFYDCQRALQSDQRHRYLMYDWTDKGTWDVKYLDDDAKRRYLQREKKRGKSTHG